jgi:hypothetical protein
VTVENIDWFRGQSAEMQAWLALADCVVVLASFEAVWCMPFVSGYCEPCVDICMLIILLVLMYGCN